MAGKVDPAPCDLPRFCVREPLNIPGKQSILKTRLKF